MSGNGGREEQRLKETVRGGGGWWQGNCLCLWAGRRAASARLPQSRQPVQEEDGVAAEKAGAPG